MQEIEPPQGEGSNKLERVDSYVTGQGGSGASEPIRHEEFDPA